MTSKPKFLDLQNEDISKLHYLDIIALIDEGNDRIQLKENSLKYEHYSVREKWETGSLGYWKKTVQLLQQAKQEHSDKEKHRDEEREIIIRKGSDALYGGYDFTILSYKDIAEIIDRENRFLQKKVDIANNWRRQHPDGLAPPGIDEENDESKLKINQLEEMLEKHPDAPRYTSILCEGITVDEAINKGLEQLVATFDEVEVEIINAGRRGFLGLGAKNASIWVTRRL